MTGGTSSTQISLGPPDPPLAAAGDSDARDREDLEIDLLLEGVYRRYGFDFREYSRASLRRRLWHRAHLEKVPTISALQERVHLLFHESLVRFGVLALGHRESIAFSPLVDDYEVIDPDERLYRKWS